MRAPDFIRDRSKRLRRAMNPPERLLWAMLRRNQLGLHFRREHPVGPFILDFYCASAKLCVEVDGPIHDDQADYDARRTEWLLAHEGIRVLRFTVAELEQVRPGSWPPSRKRRPPPPPDGGPPPPQAGEDADCDCKVQRRFSSLVVHDMFGASRRTFAPMKFPIIIALFPNKRILAYDIFSVVAWSYGLSKLFIIDVDRLLIGATFPSAMWLLDYRFILSVAMLAVLLIILKPVQFLLFALYVIMFPVLVVVWKLPVIFARMKTWVIRLALLNAVLNIFTDFRYKLIYFVICSTGIVLIAVVKGSTPSIVGLSMLAICIAASHVRAFINAFRSPRVLRLYRNFFIWAQRDTPPPKQPQPRLEVPVSNLPAEAAKDYMTSLQEKVFLNRASLFFAEKLQEYHRSEIHVVGAIFSVSFLTAWTLTIFTFMYQGALNIDPMAFEGRQLTGFELFHVAFDNFLFGTNSSAPLATMLPQLLSIGERALGWFRIAIFITIVVDIRRKKHSNEIEEAIGAAKGAGAKFELSVVSNFSYQNIDEAISDLALRVRSMRQS